jgi:hypothetical protein
VGRPSTEKNKNTRKLEKCTFLGNAKGDVRTKHTERVEIGGKKRHKF